MECESTNERIKQLVNFSNTPFFGLFTHNQISGKGQQNNNWETEIGKNITISFLLDLTTITIQNHIILNMLSANSVVKFLENYLNTKISIKWPNDIIINNKKIAGLLIEKHNNYLIVGIGINVNQEQWKIKNNATSMKLLTNINYNLNELIEDLCAEISVFLGEINEEKILADFNEKLYLKNKIATFTISKDNELKATVVGVNKDGKIILQQENNEIKTYHHGEVRMQYLFNQM